MTALGTRRIDTPYRLFCLVKGRHKWQSHGPNFLAFELRQQTVTHGLSGDSRLIRNKEDDPARHLFFSPIPTAPVASVPSTSAADKVNFHD